MRKLIFIILFIVFTIASMANTESLGAKNARLMGVDNYELTTDTLALMNSYLIDYQVDYDIYLAQGDFEGVANSLHSISLVYYTLNQMDLASNYAWRLSNVADKHGLKKQKLFSFALLSRINEKLGKPLIAKRFLGYYSNLLAEISSDSFNNKVIIGEIESNNLSDTEPKFITGDSELVKAGLPKSNPDSVQEASFIYGNSYWYGIALMMVVLMTFILVKLKSKPHVMVLEEGSDVPVKLIPLAVTIDSPIKEEKIAPVEITELPTTKKEESIKPETMENREGSPSQFNDSKATVNRGGPITPEMVRSTRTEKFYEASQLNKAPLWLSGIEHEIKDFNTLNGIRVDFNFSGDFTLVEEKVQNIVTNFLTSITETLIEANNVQSVSAQLVNSNQGLVAMIISRPVTVSRPILDTITISSIRKIFMSSEQFNISTNNVPGGMLKFVLKRVTPIKELV